MDTRLMSHAPKFNREARRLLARKFGVSGRVAQSWLTIHRTTIDDKEVEHHSHSHTFSLTTGGGDGHTHRCWCEMNECGKLDATGHNHGLDVSIGSHTHSVSGTTSVETATDLNHTHTINVTSSDRKHLHDPGTWVLGGDCNKCPGSGHNHTSSSGYYAYSPEHDHNLVGSTGTGTGTLASHTHSISLDTSEDGEHSHAQGSAGINATTCAGGYSHDHEMGSTDVEGDHDHTVTGNTDLGGEPGWSGKISGVVNPAKVMGVDKTNIAKVKGVALA